MKKKIILTWDLDGFVGAINSSFPYRYNSEAHLLELDFVERSLDLLMNFKVKSVFAITGFSAEKGLRPYTFPDLIKKIHSQGHEIASHSWRHEWLPLFSKKQIDKSFERSKLMLEAACGDGFKLTGFVPPHNKPATWIRRGAYSLEDKGLYPLFPMGDVDNVLNLLKKNDYKWARIAHNPFVNRFKKKEFTRKQRVFNHNGILVLENHYTGFDSRIIEYIETKEQEYFTISAHPIMLSFKDGRPESWNNFETFIKHFSNRADIEFVCPMNLLKTFDIN